MKTREKILQISLHVFNEEGEANITTIDIANELNISPGNLYYHFKGKEMIIEELYLRYEREITEILNAPINEGISVKDCWFYLYVVFEHIYEYRFLYLNLLDIAGRYEKIQKKIKRVFRLKHTTARHLCNQLRSHQVILNLGEDEIEALCNQIVMVLIYWFSFNEMTESANKKPEILMHQGVYQIMNLLAPHLAGDKKFFFDECRLLYLEMIKNADTKD